MEECVRDAITNSIEQKIETLVSPLNCALRHSMKEPFEELEADDEDPSAIIAAIARSSKTLRSRDNLR